MSHLHLHAGASVASLREAISTRCWGLLRHSLHLHLSRWDGASVARARNDGEGVV